MKNGTGSGSDMSARNAHLEDFWYVLERCLCSHFGSEASAIAKWTTTTQSGKPRFVAHSFLIRDSFQPKFKFVYLRYGRLCPFLSTFLTL